MWTPFMSLKAAQMELDLGSYAQAPSNKRFVVEDSITKVTSDGEPHGMMTMVAGLSGLLAAVIILAVLVSMVACRKPKNSRSSKATAATPTGAAVAMTSVPPDNANLSTLAGNLNAAFAESTLSLSGACKVATSIEEQQQWPTAVVVERY